MSRLQQCLFCWVANFFRGHLIKEYRRQEPGISHFLCTTSRLICAACSCDRIPALGWSAGCFIFPMSPFPALPQSTPPTNPPCRTPVKQMIFVRSKLRHRRKKVIFRQHCHINICNYWLNWQFVNSINITANIERAVLSCVFFVLLSLDDVGLLHGFPRFWNILKVLEYFEGFEIFWRFLNILKVPGFCCGSIVEQYQVEASHARRVSWISKRRCLRNGLHEGVKRCQGCCYQLVHHLT